MIYRAVHRCFWAFVDAILPPRCLVTGHVVEAAGILDPASWSALSFISAPYCAACGQPFDFAVEDGALCAPCLLERPEYETARHVFIYDEASRELILRFKYADHTHGAESFALWMIRAAGDSLAAVDLIVPVPLHYSRLVKRRYNQAALLAQALAKKSGKRCLPDALRRHRATEAQGHKSFRERYKNVKNAFTVNRRCADALKGRSVMLVDDVYTSGATIRECARVLKDAGAASVHVVTLARVVRPEQMIL